MLGFIKWHCRVGVESVKRLLTCWPKSYMSCCCRGRVLLLTWSCQGDWYSSSKIQTPNVYEQRRRNDEHVSCLFRASSTHLHYRSCSSCLIDGGAHCSSVFPLLVCPPSSMCTFIPYSFFWHLVYFVYKLRI